MYRYEEEDKEEKTGDNYYPSPQKEFGSMSKSTLDAAVHWLEKKLLHIFISQHLLFIQKVWFQSVVNGTDPSLVKLVKSILQ